MIMKKRTSSYAFTADVNSVTDMQQIDFLRKSISIINKSAKESAKYSGQKPKLYRVSLKARLGKSNPAAAKYKHQWIKSIKLEDAVRLDVYIHTRRDY
jgi:hypothetical protein